MAIGCWLSARPATSSTSTEAFLSRVFAVGRSLLQVHRTGTVVMPMFQLADDFNLELMSFDVITSATQLLFTALDSEL